MEMVVCLLIIGPCGLLSLPGKLIDMFRRPSPPLKINATGSAILTYSVIMLPVVIVVLYKKIKDETISSAMVFFIVATFIWFLLMLLIAIRIDRNKRKEIVNQKEAEIQHESENKEKIRQLTIQYHAIIEDIANDRAELKYTTDDSRELYLRRHIGQLEMMKERIRTELTDALLED